MVGILVSLGIVNFILILFIISYVKCCRRYPGEYSGDYIYIWFDEKVEALKKILGISERS